MLWKYIIEAGFFISWIANACLFIPQAIKIIKNKNAENLSLMTFVGFNLIQFFTLLHGAITHDWLLSFSMLLSLITCGSVSCLVWYYRTPKYTVDKA